MNNPARRWQPFWFGPALLAMMLIAWIVLSFPL